MEILSPLPLRLTALSLALPGIWLAGRSLARTMEGDRAIEAVVTPALSASLWLVAIHVLARASGSFSAGLIEGTVLISAGGIAAAFHRHWTGADQGRTRRADARWSVPTSAWIGATLAMLILVPAALNWAIHDETWPAGHMSIPAQMHNDVYPPRDVNFPAKELHYHYAFDILTAVVMALTRLPVARALDALTVASWGYAYILLWAIGERVVGRGRGHLTAVITLFGGGASYLVAAGLPPSGASFVKPYTIEGLWTNPPLSSYIFQHPWTLGLPLGLAALLVSMDRRCRTAPRYIVLGALFLLLSLSQLVLFLTLLGSIFAQEAFGGGFLPTSGQLRPIRWLRFDAGRATAMFVMIAIVLAGARGLGGFFGPSYSEAGPGLIYHPGITETFLGSVRWFSVTFGLLLPLGVAGLFLIRRGRLLFLVLLGGSFAILCFVRHAYTWDIVKFATVVSIALGILASAALPRLYSLRPRALGFALFGLAMVGATAAGFGFPVILGLVPRAVPPGLWDRAMPELGTSDAQAVTWLRTHVSPPDIIYRRKPEAYRYSVWGGLPLAWIGPEAKMMGFTERQLVRRRTLLDYSPPEPGPYLAEDLRWFVLEPKDILLSRYADRWIEEGIARERAQFGRLRIVELTRLTPESP